MANLKVTFIRYQSSANDNGGIFNLPSKYAESCSNKKVEKYVFHFVMNMGQRKNLQTSDLQIPHSDALPLSHRDSTVSKVYYEVRMTHVQQTARISSVSSWGL